MDIRLIAINGNSPEEAYWAAVETDESLASATSEFFAVNQFPAGKWSAGYAARGWLESGRAQPGTAVLVPTGPVPRSRDRRTARVSVAVTGLDGYERVRALESAVAMKLREGETIHDLAVRPGVWRSRVTNRVQMGERERVFVATVDGEQVATGSSLMEARKAAKEYLTSLPPTPGNIRAEIIETVRRTDGPLNILERVPARETVAVSAIVGKPPVEPTTTWVAGYWA